MLVDGMEYEAVVDHLSYSPAQSADGTLLCRAQRDAVEAMDDSTESSRT